MGGSGDRLPALGYPPQGSRSMSYAKRARRIDLLKRQLHEPSPYRERARMIADATPVATRCWILVATHIRRDAPIVDRCRVRPGVRGGLHGVATGRAGPRQCHRLTFLTRPVGRCMHKSVDPLTTAIETPYFNQLVSDADHSAVTASSTCTAVKNLGGGAEACATTCIRWGHL